MYLLLAFLQIFIVTSNALLMLVCNVHRAACTAYATSVEAAQSLSDINLSSWRKSGYSSDFSRDASSRLIGGSHSRAASPVPDWY